MKDTLHLRLKTLTPTFIGSGNKLLPLEVYDNGKTVKVFKFENLTRRIVDIIPPEKLRSLMLKLSEEISKEHKIKPLKELLKELNLKVEELTPDYTLEVEENFQPSEVEEFVKTLKGAYIPGSEIKGAFRTAIFYHILTTYDRVWEQFIKELRWFLKNYNPKSLKPFVQHWENKIFARKPLTEPFKGKESPKGREDMLKFLQVEDSEVKNPSEVLVLKLFHLRNSKETITAWVESLKENATFGFSLSWNSERANRFIEAYLPTFEGELKEFWKTLNIEKLLKITDEFTKDLVSFEEEKRKNNGGKSDKRQSSGGKDYLEILERLKKEVMEGKNYQDRNGIKTLERLKKESGYLLRLGKYIGRFSHSILLAVRKRDREFFENRLRKRFHSKTYWEDGMGNPLGFCRVDVS